MFAHFDADVFGQLMKLPYFVQRRIVKCAPNEPGFVTVAEKIPLAQVFDPDQAFVGVMVVNARRADIVFLQKLRDLDVMTVLFPLEIIFYQDQRLVGGTTDTIKSSVRSSLFDRRNIYLIDIEARKMPARLVEKRFGAHDQMSMLR